MEGQRVLAGLRFDPWKGLEGLEAAVPFWRQLQPLVALDPLCNDPDWGLAYARAHRLGDQAFGWCVRDASGAPAAFLAFRREPSRGRFALRRALLLCDGTFDSDYIDLVVRPGLEHDVLSATIDALAGTRGVDAVHYHAAYEGSPVARALGDVLERRGLPSRTAGVPCADAPLTETFDTYLASLKKRMRSKVRQALRVAEERGATLSWCHDAATLDEHLEGLFRLHGMRWEESGEAGAFASEDRRRFYRAFAPLALDAGTLRFSRLDLDGRPVAYQFGARVGERYYQMQEGYDTTLAEARVATALRGLSVRALIEEGVRHYDFMAGMSRHKRDWGGAPHDCVSIAFALPNVRARLSYGARALVDRIRASRTEPEADEARASSA